MGHLSHAFESHGAIACILIQCQQCRLCLCSIESVRLHTLSAVCTCCDKQRSLRGYACSEKCSTFNDTYHLQKRLCTCLAVPQLETSSAPGQWRAHYSSVVPCLAHHQATAWMQGGALTWSQLLPMTLAWSEPSERYLPDALSITFVHDRPQCVVPAVDILLYFILFFILSFYTRKFWV